MSEHGLGHLQLLADRLDFLTSRRFKRLGLDLVSTQGQLTFALRSQVVEALHEFGKNIAFGHGVDLALTSLSSAAFNALRWSLLRSSSSSLS
ncbi:hypothetical protein D9M71_789340 [compost metagenome]